MEKIRTLRSAVSPLISVLKPHAAPGGEPHAAPGERRGRPCSRQEKIEHLDENTDTSRDAQILKEFRKGSDSETPALNS